MKITIENTSKIVYLSIRGAGDNIPARVWQGETVTGDGVVVPVQCFITRIAPEIPESDPNIDRLTAEFERDLKRQAKARPSVEAIPLRLII